MPDEPTLLHHVALDVLLAEATSHRRWRSRAELASECGFSPATFTHATKGNRGLSDMNLDALLDVTGWPREALVLPVRARSGDLETARLLAEVKRLREYVVRGTDKIADAIRQRGD